MIDLHALPSDDVEALRRYPDLAHIHHRLFGEPECTAYRERPGVVRVIERRKAYAALPRDPTTGRPTIA